MSFDPLSTSEAQKSKAAPSPSFLKLMRFLLRCWWSLLGGISLVFIGTLCTLLEPRLFGYAIDEGIVPKRWDRLQWITGAYLGLICLRALVTIQQSYLFESIGQRITQDLRVHLFSYLQRIPVGVFDQTPTGRLLTRVTNDIASLNEMFSSGFVSMAANVLIVIGILIGMMMLDPHLGLIASSVFPVLVVAAIYFSQRLKGAYYTARSKLSSLNAFLAENLLGMRIIQLFNRQRLHLNQFDQFNRRYAEAQTLSTRIFALFQPSITLAAGLSVALVIWFGGKEALSGSLKLGVLVAYFSYILALFQPVREIADKWNVFLSGMASAERIFSILEWKTEYTEQLIHAPVKALENLKGNIVFENIWFAYRGEDWVLKDFSLEIRAGERIGVVGHTGAGKTTLISLLMRFYEPQRGRILIDGQDIREYHPRSLRSSIGIVQQDVFLFSGSFEENIALWKKVDRERLADVLKKLRLGGQADEVLQERGSNFSIGERQVIAFGRALLANPSIWILDEATANIDSETEALIQSALDVASIRKTTILIAHRLATVRSADRILVLNQGKLIEMGKHEELMQMNGLYARLYRYQQFHEAHEVCNLQNAPVISSSEC